MALTGVGVLIGRVALAVAAVSLTSCVYLDWKQRQIIFRPTAEIAGTPEDFALHYEDVWLPVPSTSANANADRIHGWWIPGENAKAPALLFLHGNGWNIGDSAYNTARLRRMGYSVLAIDYRGYGRSRGEFPSEAQVYEDAQVAWRHLRRLAPDARQRYIYGHSLGGAIAIDLAVRNTDAAGLIVEGSFTSSIDMAKRGKFLRLLPLRWLVTQRFDSLSKVGALRMPVLFIQGGADDVVPAEMSQRLYAAAPEPKRLVIIPNAGHSSVAVLGLQQYRQAVQDFVNGTRAPPR